MFVCKISFRWMLFLHTSSCKRTLTADTYTRIKRAVKEQAGMSAEVQHARVPPVLTSRRDLPLSCKRISEWTCTEQGLSSRHWRLCQWRSLWLFTHNFGEVKATNYGCSWADSVGGWAPFDQRIRGRAHPSGDTGRIGELKFLSHPNPYPWEFLIALRPVGDYIFWCVYRNGRLFENDKVMGSSFNTRHPCPWWWVHGSWIGGRAFQTRCIVD